MAFYDDMAATATELIAEFGAPITLTKITPQYDAEESEVTESTSTYTGVAVRTEYKINDIDGTYIQQGDALLVIAPEGMEKPETGDEITYDGETWKVVNGSIVRPATTTVCFKAQIRK